MTNRRKNHALTEEELHQIVRKYETKELRSSSAYGDGGIEPLWARFARAAGNQIDSGDATLSRYAIWANTVRDNIAEAIEQMEAGEKEEAKRLMVRAANSLSAFSDVQAYFDPFRLGETK
jgi:uncharacterized protein (UPF0147 family)